MFINQFSKLFSGGFILSLCLTAICLGQLSGELDQTFFAGKTTAKIGIVNDFALATAIQTDGKIIAAGYNYTGTKYNFAVARYNADGSLDKSFSNDGKESIAVGNNQDIANAAIVQPDGKIVLAGSSYDGANTNFALIRLNTDGSLDNSFDGDGKATALIGAYSVISSVAIQSNGKIVVAGNSYNGSNYDFALARFNANGTLDNTFDGDGKVTTAIGLGDDFAFSAAIQTDGKIVAAGYFANGFDSFALVRYNTNGSLDNTFDGDGKAVGLIGSGNCRAHTVAIQADGKIVAAGRADSASNGYDFALTRFLADGSLDPAFDGDGKVMTSLEMDDETRSVVIQPADNKIVVAGYTANPGATQIKFGFARYNTNGSLDTSFDTDGKASISIGGSNDIAYAVALQSDGKIVAAGYTENGTNDDFAVARLNANGSPDGTFGNRVFTNFGSDNAQANSTAIQSDGKIVVAGFNYNGSNRDFAVSRYNADGTLDFTFGNYGKVTTAVGGGIDDAQAVAIQTDGKILVAGYSNAAAHNNFAVVRYNTNGTPDNTFGVGGKMVTEVGTADSVAYAMAIQSDGKIVLAGTATQGGDYDFAVVRYNTNGTLDNTFEGDGRVFTPVGTSNDTAYAVAIQTDGKIVAAGEAYNGGANRDFALARYNANGSLDTNFDNDGKSMVEMGSLNDTAKSLTIQSNGRIIVGGYGFFTNWDFELARFNADGILDTDFDGDGRVVTDLIPGNSDHINAVAVQADGKIVVGGYTSTGFQTTSDAAFARYNTDGSLDTGFDFSAMNPPDEKMYSDSSNFVGDGKVVIPIGGGDDHIYDIAIQPNGKIVAVGDAVNGEKTDFAVIRLNGNPIAPTAANVSIAGKVTDTNGRGVSRAVVMLTGSRGSVRQTITNPFGYYRFTEVEVGQTYILNVFSKQYQFAPQVVMVMDDIEDLNFFAQ
jgi:uncharacterized delta-60 repeat protein